jgi:hypothetical protein
MIRRLFLIAPVLAGAMFALSTPTPAQDRKIDHPRLRAALHELREARAAVQGAKDAWPPGLKESALESIQAAIKSIRTILNVEDVENFRGVDRNADYYRKFADHPRLRAALADLRDARDELRTAKADFGGLKEQALDNIDVASGDIVRLIRYKR